MLNQVRCALGFYGLHDKRECAFRIDTKTEEDDDDEEKKKDCLQCQSTKKVFFIIFQIILMWKHFKFDPHSISLSCHTDVTLNQVIP